MSDSTPLLRFDRFTFDPASGDLRAASGDSVRLEPQPAKVLALLAGRAGELVSREELQRQVWPDGTFVDFERGLNYCVAKIRAALGDSAAEPRFVETLPRRGYRFLMALEEDEDLEDPERGGNPSGLGKPKTGRPVEGGTRAIPPPVILAMAVAILTAFGAVAWFARQPAKVPTIAVARFDNETGRQTLDARAQTLTDSIVERLTNPPGRWSVIGNAAILRTPRSFRDLGAIRSALGADLILLGQIQESEGRLRVVVHLIRARDEKHLWANRFPVAEGEWAAMERTVLRAVREAVEAQRAAGV